MHDRVSLHPGRVTMTPVAGQANTYDMVRADDPTQAGTPLNKTTFLKDATAALYGLGTGAVPDDVLAELGKYKQYWWRRRDPGHYVLQETSISAPRTIYMTYDSVVTYTYGSSVTINQTDGTVTIDNPQTFTTEEDPKASIFDPLIGSYYMCDKPMRDPYTGYNVMLANTLYFIPDGTAITNNGEGYYLATAAMKISTKKTAPGDWQYLHSSTRSAYPDSGTQDGYEYEYLGIPLDNAVTAPKIETGSYVGTGTYGVSNPNTLTFGITPKMVFMTDGANSFEDQYTLFFPWLESITDLNIKRRNQVYALRTTISGNTISWFNGTDAEYQWNIANHKYCYLVIG